MTIENLPLKLKFYIANILQDFIGVQVMFAENKFYAVATLVKTVHA